MNYFELCLNVFFTFAKGLKQKFLKKSDSSTL